jgi:hypothetical protein
MGYESHNPSSKAIRTHHPLNPSSIRPSYQDSFLYTSFFRTHHPLYLILYTNYQRWSPLVSLSKYIYVRSSFEEFIETNLMVQSEFNLAFWFVSYNIFLVS